MQQLWVSDLRAAGDYGCAGDAHVAGGVPGASGGYGVSAEPLVVYAADDLAGRCCLGQAVELVGYASQRAAPAPAAAAPAGLVPHAKASVEVGMGGSSWPARNGLAVEQASRPALSWGLSWVLQARSDSKRRGPPPGMAPDRNRG
mgnify:CR=1 FL=1